MQLTDSNKLTLAKSFTELAIQNELFRYNEDSAKTAEQITTFFNAVTESLGKPLSN